MSDSSNPQDDLALGHAALKRAAWADAKSAFERALSRSDSAEAHDGLGIALWWLNDIHAAHEQRAAAYRLYRESGMAGKAAMIACWLAREQIFLHANFPAMQGWFVRAEQLISQVSSDDQRAWFAMLRASVTALPSDMIAIASNTIATARQTGNSSLEAFALAFYGQALVTLGHVGDGMARLDEAMTMATGGEVTDFTVICEVFCVMLSSCETAHDLVRSDMWCRIASEFAQRYRCPFLSAYCRTAYGGLMTALGRWQEAETVLLEAIQAFERGHRGLRVHAVIKLAQLRVSQGKIEEAEVMLAGLEDQSAAVIPLARLCQQKGETALAKAILEQALPDATGYTLHHLPLLLLLVDVMLSLDDLTGVERIMVGLTNMTEQAHSQLLTAQIEFTRGRVRLQAGDFVSAKANFNAALANLHTYEQSLLAGQVRLQMAQTLQQGDPMGAVAWAKAALATFERLGAEHEIAQAMSVLRQLGVARKSAPHQNKPLTERETEIVRLVSQGLSNREIADRLVISAKTVEHHVSHILGKLNLHNRSEIAAFTASGKLTFEK